MSARSVLHADLAHAAYRTPATLRASRTQTSKYEPIHREGVEYVPVRFLSNMANGFQGTVVQKRGAGQFIVAFRGTEPNAAADVITDTMMVARLTNNQLADASRLVEEAVALASKWRMQNPDLPAPEVTVTGHSLGGTLAQLMAARHGLRGETFNAYGAAGLLHGVPEGGNQVINHVLATDVVSAASPHFGEVRVYALAEKLAVLEGALGGYGGKPGQPGNPLLTAIAVGGAVHGIHLFSRMPRSDGKPDTYTVLQDPQAQLRAAQHAEQIHAYRQAIGALRAQLTAGATMGTALGDHVGRLAALPMRLQAGSLELAGEAVRGAGQLQAAALAGVARGVGQVGGSVPRGVAALGADGRHGLGHARAAMEQLQAEARGTARHGIASALRVLGEALPEPQRQRVQQVAEELEQQAQQARLDGQAQAQQVREEAQREADQLRRWGEQAAQGISAGVQDVARPVVHSARVAAGWVDERLDAAAGVLQAHAEDTRRGSQMAGAGVGLVAALAGGTLLRNQDHAGQASMRGIAEVLREAEVAQPSSYLQGKVGYPLPQVTQPPPTPMSAAPLSYRDAGHPQHLLYARIRDGLPQTVSDGQVAALTLQARQEHISTAERVESLAVVRGYAVVHGTRPGQVTDLQLDRPAPRLDETMARAEAFEQLEAQRWAEFEALQQRIQTQMQMSPD